MQVGKADWQAVQQGPPWAVDAWGLGCLIQEAYRGKELARTEELRDTSSIPKSVLPVSPLALALRCSEKPSLASQLQDWRKLVGLSGPGNAFPLLMRSDSS